MFDFLINHWILFAIALSSALGLLVLSSDLVNQKFFFGLQPEQLVTLMNKGGLVLIDLRDSEEVRRTGIIKGARLIPHASFSERSAASNRFGGKPVVLLCQDGERSKMLARENRKTGVQAYYLVGGVNAWIVSCFPLCSAK